MIQNKKVAKHIGKLMGDITSQLNDSLILVQEECTDEEFKLYRDGVAHILGVMLVRVMNPLYMENPDIKPDDFYLPGITPENDE